MKKAGSLILMATMAVIVIVANGSASFGTSLQKLTVRQLPTGSVQSEQSTSDQATADSLSAIVSDKSLSLVFTNDSVHPWNIGNSGDGYLHNGNVGISNSSSSFSFSYNCEQRTELSFDWACYNYGSHKLCLYIDGVEREVTTSSSDATPRYYVDPGSHIVTFKDTIAGYTYAQRDWSHIRNLCVRPVLPLDTVILSAKSQPLNFVNESAYPWMGEDGYAQSGNYGHPNTVSSIHTTLTLDKPSKLSFWSSTYCYNENGNTYNYSGYHYFCFKINGRTYMGRENGSGTTSLLLQPGNYTLEWSDSIYSNNNYSPKSRIKDVQLTSDWIDIELTKAGTLGVEVLYQADVLNDVELLKVKGPLNSDDWTTIKNMKNLVGLDISAAQFDAVPDYAFDGLASLSSVTLPEGVKSIGQYAFRGTQLLNIDIPSSVTSIGQYAFAGTRVRTVNFKEDSKLTHIGYSAFNKCTSLERFVMPNSVTTLGTYNNNVDYTCGTFDGCTNLEEIHFSDALSTLEQSVCSGCSKLKDVHLPQNILSICDYAFRNTPSLRRIDLPSSLKRIDNDAFYQCGVDSVKLPIGLTVLESYAFRNCGNLKYLELPSYIGSYSYNFNGCNSIQKIVSKSATPPAISDDPFQNGPSKANVTLVVPSFAVANYKLDSYWYQFGNIQEMDVDLDYWRIASALSLTNNRRMNGKPDIDLYYGGQFTVSGNAPMTVKNFDIFVSESNPGRLLNDCVAMTADSITSHFYVDANKWYFMTPLHDVDLTKVTHSNSAASFVFRYYDAASRATNGTGSSWRNMDDGNLSAGKGYIFQTNVSGVMTMPSDAAGHIQVLNTNDVTTKLESHVSTASANKSWNYVGNPYPTYYDIYYMDFTAPITVWTGSTYKAYSIADDNFVLRPMQSFFVQKPDAVDNIVFHKEGRQMTSGIERTSTAKGRAMAPANISRKFFNLQISNEEDLVDETRIVLNEDAQIGYEIERDASKFMSMNVDVPQIYTIDAEGNRYAINERPQKDGNIGLGYLAPQDGFYTVSAMKAEGEIMLLDKEQNKHVDLSSQDYTFYSKATEGVNGTRFMLMVKANNGDATGIGNTTISETRVDGGKGLVTITSKAGAAFIVHSLNGTTVFDGTVTAGCHAVPLPAGVYIIKVNNLTSKVIVY